MKKIILINLALWVAIGALAQTSVSLKINHLLNDEAFEYNKTAQNDLNNSFNIARLEYYISGVKLLHDGGKIISASDVYLLVNGSTSEFTIGSYDITNLEAIGFSIGVNSPENNQDPSKWPSTHALAPKAPSMHWGWASGYRFVAIEGKAGAALNTEYQVHALGNQNYFAQQISTNVTASNNKIEVVINADYAQLLSGIPVQNGIITHGDFDEAPTLLRNFQTKVFTNTEGAGNILSVKEVEPTSTFTLFPNPSNAYFTIAVEDVNFRNSSIDIKDIAGKLVYKATLQNAQHDVSNLEAGVYTVSLVNHDGLQVNKKVVIQ